VAGHGKAVAQAIKALSPLTPRDHTAPTGARLSKFMYIQLKNNHLPINPIFLAARHGPVDTRGVLSPDELRRIVADMVD